MHDLLAAPLEELLAEARSPFQVVLERAPEGGRTCQWLSVHDAAHRVGLRSNVTLMFGHVDTPKSWARHLVRAREQQKRSGGFTEFVPLPFVPMEAPIYLQGRARCGPTFREALLVHAVARLALHPLITNIQASWVKLGPEGTRECEPPSVRRRSPSRSTRRSRTRSGRAAQACQARAARNATW